MTYNSEIDNFLAHPRRKQPSNLLSVIQIDGGRINILTKDNGKLGFKYLVAAIDVSSLKIVSYRIVDIENFEAYKEILTDIIKNNIIYPSEIVLDNLRQLKSQKSDLFFKKLISIGINIRFHKKQNPQDKAQIENWFKLFNIKFLKLIDGFLGGGITSKNKDSRPNDKILLESRKGKNAYSVAALSKIIKENIELYNNSPAFNTKKIPNLYFEQNYPMYDFRGDVEKKERFLFLNESLVLINKSYISITIQNKIYEYLFYDNHYQFVKDNFGKHVVVRYDSSNPENLYIYKNGGTLEYELFLKYHINLPMAKHEMTPDDQLLLNAHAKKIKAFKDKLAYDGQKFREKIINFDLKNKSNKKVPVLTTETIPIDLIDAKFDSKQVIHNSINSHFEDNKVGDAVNIIKNMKDLFKVKGSNSLLN